MPPIAVDPRVRLCMMHSTLFTAEMVARYGGHPRDFRPQLERLVRLGVLGKARGGTPRSVAFYHRLPAAEADHVDIRPRKIRILPP